MQIYNYDSEGFNSLKPEDKIKDCSNNNSETSSDTLLEYLLKPLRDILQEKNIVDCFFYRVLDNKLYCCFLQEALSSFNKRVLLGISRVYNETFIYCDDFDNPRLGHLENWPPDFDEVRDRALISKKFVAFEIDINDKLMILGATIMLANIFQMQDPFTIPKNKDKDIYSVEETLGHDKYLANGSPDLSWFLLSVVLDKNNPLHDNEFAPSMVCLTLNSPIACESALGNILIGYEYKTYLTFKLDEEDLVKEINDYIKGLSKAEKDNIVKLINPSISLMLIQGD